MAWTAKLLRLSKKHGRVDFDIRYSDGIDAPVDKHYSFDRTNKAAIRALVRREVARLQEIKDEVIDIIVNQEIDLTPPAPPPDPPDPPGPTPAQIAKRAWFRDLNKLRVLLKLVDLGILPGSDPRIVPLRTSLTADLLNSYLSRIDY